MIKNMIKNMFKNNYKPILGRWNHTKNLDELNRKVYLANYDNCSPCGNLELKNKKEYRIPKHLTLKLEELISTNNKNQIHRMITKLFTNNKLN